MSGQERERTETSAASRTRPRPSSACVSFGLKRYFMSTSLAVEDLHHLRRSARCSGGAPPAPSAPGECAGDNRQTRHGAARGSRGSSPAPSRAGPARPGSAPGRRASRSRIFSSFAWFCRSTSWFWSLGALEVANSRRLSALESCTSSFEVANVVLHVALLAGVEAALERQHEHDQYSRMAPDGGYGPTDQQGLPIGRRTARRAASRAPVQARPVRRERTGESLLAQCAPGARVVGSMNGGQDALSENRTRKWHENAPAGGI